MFAPKNENLGRPKTGAEKLKVPAGISFPKLLTGTTINLKVLRSLGAERRAGTSQTMFQ